MSEKNQNIEDWFVLQSKEKFPNEMDYAAKYKTIRDYMNTQIHAEIKAIVTQIVPETYLNDHGEKHIKKVIEKASEIININDKLLSAYEVFFLLVAIQIHDAGHIINGRSDHALNAKKIISKFGAENISTVEKKFVSSIAKAHSGKDDPIGNLNENQLISGEKINLKLISAILRLADELADDATRASLFVFENEKIPEKSVIFHAFSLCLDSCVAEPEIHQIKLNFYLKESLLKDTYFNGHSDVYLLDEIYSRTIKTYLECLYCSRFLPEKNRFNTINVDIEIQTENDSITPTTISYRIMEKGYPDLSNRTIFEICSNELSYNGELLNGKYYSNQIEKLISHD